MSVSGSAGEFMEKGSNSDEPQWRKDDLVFEISLENRSVQSTYLQLLLDLRTNFAKIGKTLGKR